MSKILFVTGGSASGKTTISQNIKKALGDRATLISQDMFYIPTKSDKANYDIPQAFDWDLQKQILNELKKNREVSIPIYSFEEHDRVGSIKVRPSEIIIFEGLFTFWDYELTKLADFQIFVDTPSDTRLARRLKRDIEERGRETIEVITRWQKDVQPSFVKYIKTMKKHADIIVPWTKVKSKAVSALITIIQNI